MSSTSKSANLIFLMGPTAAGKTQLALKLVQKFPIEIINVDSALIYRGMDIGTGKPTAAELHQVPHHLIDIRDPSESYSVANFRQDALDIITDILARKRIPLLVGGTMLYFHALQYGLAKLPSADPALRAELANEAQQLGLQALHTRLAKIDPIAAQRIHPNDPQRLLRALEVYQMTGKSLTKHLQQQHAALPYSIVALALSPSTRQILHQRIEARFYAMLEKGFIEEVKHLKQQANLHANLPAMRAVGYRQIWHYLEGEYDYEQMCAKAIAATRQLAKRQLTWLRRWQDLQWLTSDEPDLLAKAHTLLTKIKATP